MHGTGFWQFLEHVRTWLGRLAGLFDAGIRIWVAQAFFKSGLTKIADWDSTQFLFQEIYSVPLLSPGLAAGLATAMELVLPPLLVIGIATRLSAAGLFAFNAIAVISYPELGAAGIKDHVLWGLMLAMLVFHGPGQLSADSWLRRRYAAQ